MHSGHLRMKWLDKWNLKSCPELAALPDEKQRKQVVAAAQWIPLPLFLVAFGVIHPIMIFALRGWFESLDDKYSVLPHVVYFTIFGSVVVFTFRMLYGKRMARAMRQKINELGVPVCIECGYQMQGTSEPRCPECGEPFSSVEIRGPSEPQG